MQQEQRNDAAADDDACTFEDGINFRPCWRVGFGDNKNDIYAGCPLCGAFESDAVDII